MGRERCCSQAGARGISIRESDDDCSTGIAHLVGVLGRRSVQESVVHATCRIRLRILRAA